MKHYSYNRGWSSDVCNPVTPPESGSRAAAPPSAASPLGLCLLPMARMSQGPSLAPEALLAGLATSGGSAQDTVVFLVP